MFDDIESTFEVPRVDRPSRDEFEERFLVPQRPVVISGAMDGWPPLESWTNDYLTAKVGARPVPAHKHEVRASGPSRVYTDPKHGTSDIPDMKLSTFIDLLGGAAISDGQYYAARLPIKSSLPELWPDVRFPRFVDEDKYRAVNLWFGPGNNLTPLHWDPSNNFLAQIRGRKQILLCPPREIARLYPLPFSCVANHYSQVNVISPDLTQFPAWTHVDRAVLEIGPGDILFIPFCWWHSVWGIDQNLSINYWWRPHHANLLRHPRQTTRTIFRKALVRLTSRRSTGSAPRNSRAALESRREAMKQ